MKLDKTNDELKEGNSKLMEQIAANTEDSGEEVYLVSVNFVITLLNICRLTCSYTW